MMKRFLCCLLCLSGLWLLAWGRDMTPAEPTVRPTDADKTLARHALAAAQQAQGTVGQEQANMLLNGWVHGMLDELSGRTPATAKQLAGARNEVTHEISVMESALSWPQPLAVMVNYAVRPPVIDGKLDDVVWQSATTFTGAFPLNSAVVSPTPKTVWRLLWDEQYLYAGFECEDPQIIAPPLERDGAVYNSDCVELFLMPDKTKMTYWELEFSPTGSIFDSLCVKSADHWGGKFDNSATMNGLKVAAQIDGTANSPDPAVTSKGYTMEVAIPWNALPGAAPDQRATSADTLYFMMARMDKNRDNFTAYAFTPLLSWTHNVWNYAPMMLVSKPYQLIDIERRTKTTTTRTTTAP